METLGYRVDKAMKGAGIKARTFAGLVGCHYSTIYYLLRNKDSAIPLRIVQERILTVLDFLDDSIKVGLLPIQDNLTVQQKTIAVKKLFESYLDTPENKA